MKHFIVIGAQRSGTTYLYSLLNSHPDICMASPVKPEPKYFMNKQAYELDYNQYRKTFFAHCEGEKKVFGEKSTSYYEREESARLISSLLPKAKIILLLRNPIERALSNYYFSVNNGLEKRSIEEVFSVDDLIPEYEGDISVNPYNYKQRGLYIDFLEIYLQYFTRDQIKVVIFEELANNLNEIKELYDFLEIDNEYVPSNIQNVVNASEKSVQVPKHIRASLKCYYQNSIDRLECKIDKNLSIWK